MSNKRINYDCQCGNTKYKLSIGKTVEGGHAVYRCTNYECSETLEKTDMTIEDFTVTNEQGYPPWLVFWANKNRDVEIVWAPTYNKARSKANNSPSRDHSVAEVTTECWEDTPEEFERNWGTEVGEDTHRNVRYI